VPPTEPAMTDDYTFVSGPQPVGPRTLSAPQTVTVPLVGTGVWCGDIQSPCQWAGWLFKGSENGGRLIRWENFNEGAVVRCVVPAGRCPGQKDFRDGRCNAVGFIPGT
jgi:hypothetical protein